MRIAMKSISPVLARYIFHGWLFFLLAWRLAAQPLPTPHPHFWRVNGPVYDLLVVSNLAYLAGGFTYIGPASGNAALVELSTGRTVPEFPPLDGKIYAVAADGQGGWFVGGLFGHAESGLKNLVHVLANRRVSPVWAPQPDAAVRGLALSSDQLYVGGDFTHITGAARSYLVSLSAQTGRTNNWAPRSQLPVTAMALADDTLYVGGSFRNMNGVTRTRLAALDANTAALQSWDPGLSGGGNLVNCLAVAGGMVYVGGDFTTCGTKPRNRIAAIDAITGVASGWNPNAVLTGGTAAVNALALVDNAVYVGGSFSSIGSRNRNHLAALDVSTGQALETWDPNPSAAVYALCSPGTDLVVGGSFVTIAGGSRNGLAVLERSSAMLQGSQTHGSSLQVNVAITVNALAEQGGFLAVGGTFSSFGGVERRHLAGLDLTTGIATDWDPGTDKDVYTLALGNGCLYAGGAFTTIGGSNIALVAAVNPDNGQTLDWNPNASKTSTHLVADLVFTGGRLFVGGLFTTMGGEARANLAELSPSTAKATAWKPAPQAIVRALAVDDSRLYVGGDYTSIAGVNSARLAAFNLSDGALVTGFAPKPDAAVRALARIGERLHVGGDFTQIAGQSRSRVAALHPETGVEPAIWNPEVGVTGQLRVYSLAAAGDALYVGGTFAAVGGEFRKNLAAVSRTSGLAQGWNPGPNQVVRAFGVAANSVLVAGDFTEIAGESCAYFAGFSSQPAFVGGSSKVTTNGVVQFQVTDGDGRGSSLVVQATDDLRNPSWQTLHNLPISGSPKLVEDAEAAGKNRRFYRVEVEGR